MLLVSGAATNAWAVADEWSSGTDYEVGDFCRLPGAPSDCTYKCVQAHTADAGNAPPAEEYWEQVWPQQNPVGAGGDGPTGNDWVDFGTSTPAYGLDTDDVAYYALYAVIYYSTTNANHDLTKNRDTAGNKVAYIRPKSDYTANATTVTITDTGAGTGAIAKPGVHPVTGEVLQIAVANGGSGYAAGTTTVTIGGSGTGATATPVIVSGEITAINVTNAGSGYESCPSVADGDRFWDSAYNGYANTSRVTGSNCTTQNNCIAAAYDKHNSANTLGFYWVNPDDSGPYTTELAPAKSDATVDNTDYLTVVGDRLHHPDHAWWITGATNTWESCVWVIDTRAIRWKNGTSGHYEQSRDDNDCPDPPTSLYGSGYAVYK
jgi:hypothetical protein